ncbi:MAG: metallophosphatase domain-containing protein [Saprospiraceae bacterium]
MKFVAISDTHGKHHLLTLPEGDILVHAGDISSRGTEYEIRMFLDWFAGLDFKYKIFVAGNHDFYLERTEKHKIDAILPDGVIYLNDSGILIEDLYIWGSPVTPWFYDWAFNRQRGSEIKKHWDLIPNDTDIIITHGPAYGILDRTIRNLNVGCEELKEKIEEVKPKIHICGHIHEDYGCTVSSETRYINASVLNFSYEFENDPVSFIL